jgi:branched-subunit amino acid ABC-type transport system permease component
LNTLILAVGFGLVTASVLAIAAIGLTLQVGVTNLVNFAFADFLTLGAYLAWTLNAAIHLNFWLAAALASLIVGVVAVLANIFVIRPFLRRRTPLVFLLIVTIGLSLILGNVNLAIWGSSYRSYDLAPQQPIHVGPLQFTQDQLVIMAISVGVMVAIRLLLTRTKLGKAMRSMSDNMDLARASGIDTDRVTHAVWMLSGTLAGLAGVVLALNLTTFDTGLGSNILFVIFAAMILGGVGSPSGAILAAVVLGLATEVSAVFVNSGYKNDIAFLALLVVLMLRPQGIVRMAGKN